MATTFKTLSKNKKCYKKCITKSNTRYKTKRIAKSIYLTPDQSEALKEYATSKGLTVTAVLRLIVDKTINENLKISSKNI